jgi:hypothetical protein
MNRIKCISFVLITISSLSFGQVKTIKKLEIPLQNAEFPFTVIPVAKYGFILIREHLSEVYPEKKNWEIRLYDTDMNLSRTSLIESEFMFGLIGHTCTNNLVYLLFAGIKDMKKKFFMHQIDLQNDTNKKIPIETYIPDHITYFSSFRNSLIFGGRDKGRNSFVMFNPEEKKSTILQGIFERKSEILDINLDTSNQLLTVLVTYLNRNRQVSLNLRSFDPYGQPLENIRLEPSDTIDFINARTFIINNDLRIIGGIFQDRKSDNQNGMFLCSVKLDGEQRVKYYSLEAVLQVLDSVNGPDVNYSPNEFDHLTNEDNWAISNFYDIGWENVIIIESHNNQKYYTGSGDPKKMFVYDLGLIIGFDDQLEISWLNYFRMDNTVTNEFSNFIKLSKTDRGLRLYYFYLNLLKEKEIIGSKTIKFEYPVHFIQVEYKKDIPVKYNNDLSRFQKWYDDFHLFSGVKSYDIKDEAPIFFIQKLEYGR